MSTAPKSLSKGSVKEIMSLPEKTAIKNKEFALQAIIVKDLGDSSKIRLK